MSCPPTVIANGLFIDVNSIAWSTAPSQTAGTRSVTRTASGITATGPTGSVFHPTVAGYTSKYMFFGGDNFLVLLDIEGSAGSSTRRVSLVDFTTTPPNEVPILMVGASSNAVPPPNIQYSQGNGAAFLVFASDGSQITNCAIRSSIDGDVLCAGPPPFIATGETQGEATAANVLIHYSSGGTSHVITCPKPQGSCQITPSTQTFPEAVVGGPAASATTTRTFTIRNNGTDCLTVGPITNVAPYTVQSTSQPLPANLPSTGDSLTVTVAFTPTSVGSFDRTLPVTRSPAVGDSGLHCVGTGRLPTHAITITPATLTFAPPVVVGDSAMLSARIRNSGETPVTVSWTASSGGPYSWAGSDGGSGNPVTLLPGEYRDVAVTFTPTAEGPAPSSIPVTHDATGPHSITLTGSGCVPNAVMAPPASAPVSFGDVQRGFRMVRFFSVRNTGDATLTFQASITGPDAALFRLVDPAGSITGGLASMPYSVAPVTPCGPGPSGPGQVVVAVVVFADHAPGTVGASLVLDAHNGSNVSPATYTYPLSANVVAGVPVDAIAVFDRSGSMAEPAGPRTKTEVEVSAGTLLAQLAREDVDDQLGLVKFDEVPVTIQPLTAVTAANHASITGHVNSTELAPGGSTCIAGGLIEAFRRLGPAPATTRTRAVVVLTDGMDNTAYLNPDDTRWYSLLGGVVNRPDSFFSVVDTDPVAVPAGIRVYGVGLGTEENIDHGRLDALSAPTGGYFGIVGTDLVGAAYFNLEKYFTQIYMNMVGTAPLLDPVFTIQAGEEQRIEFDVLRGDVGALVVLYDTDGMRLPFHLESPTGEVIEASHVPPGFQLRSGFTDTARFVDFVLPAGEPDRYAGRWAVVVKHGGEVCFGDPQTKRRKDGKRGDVPWGFTSGKCRKWRKPVDYGIAIGVGSNLRMQPYVTPGIVHVGDPLVLTAVVTEAGLPVTGCDVTVRAEAPSGTVWTFPLRDDGTHNDGAGDDGEYARTFGYTHEAGGYQFTFRAEGVSRNGEPVVREAVLAKYVEGRVRIEPEKPDCRYEPPTQDEVEKWLAEQRKRAGGRTKPRPKPLPKARRAAAE
jgi:hypothetical protein